MKDCWRLYRGVARIFGIYWSAYGGWRALLCSPYIHISCVLAFLSALHPFSEKAEVFYDLGVIILPGMLGFTLAGIAILMAFGDSAFLERLCGTRPDEDNDYSPLVSHAANYVHFLVTQGATLVFSIFAKSLLLNSFFFNFIGYFGLYYSVFLCIATVLSVFRMVRHYDRFKANNPSRR